MLAADIQDIRKNGANFWNVTGVILGGISLALPFVSGLGGTDDVARGIGRAVSRWRGSGFRKKLIKLTGLDPGTAAEAHHVFPVKFGDRFKGIDINDPRFGAWWETSSHRKLWREYNERWQRFLEKNPTREEILDFGRELAKEYGFKINY